MSVIAIERRFILHQKSVGKRVFVFTAARSVTFGVRLAIARLDVLLLQGDRTIDLGKRGKQTIEVDRSGEK